MYGGTERSWFLTPLKDTFILTTLWSAGVRGFELDGGQKLLGGGLTFVFSYDCNIQLRIYMYVKRIRNLDYTRILNV